MSADHEPDVANLSLVVEEPEPIVAVICPSRGGELRLWVERQFIDYPMQLSLEYVHALAGIDSETDAVVKGHMEQGHFALRVDPMQHSPALTRRPMKTMREKLAEVIGSGLVDEVLNIFFTYNYEEPR